MRFRTHLGRDFDLRLRSNQLLFGLVGVAAVAAVVMLLADGPIEVLFAPVILFANWALVREIDPDHDWTALVAGVGAAVWLLGGFGMVAIGATFGLMLTARVLLSSTGRRPLVGDLIFVGVVATVISGSVFGWVAGFGIAIAIYVDNRMAEEHQTYAVVIAALTALASSAVATAARVFPQEVPDVEQITVIGVGILALMTIAREPEPPFSLVDSRRKTPMVPERLHAARSAVAVLAFVGALLAGPSAEVVVPIAFAMMLSLASNEIERVHRRSS